MTGYAKAKHAATVILLRPARDDGSFEVFMTRRPPAMNFLGGAYVFPGGSVRKEDSSEAILKLCHGFSPEQARETLGADLSPQLALGQWVGGIRELFEEVGVLLCVTQAGEPMDMKREGFRQRLARKRQGLIGGSTDFLTLLESEGLFCDAARMSYFSHWLTPEEFPMRFDTRFYLAPLPPDQRPLATSEEVEHSFWIQPERALKLCQEGSLPVIFPTFSSLRTLADFDTLERLFEEYRVG